jgi:hypothetical protein
MKRFRSLTYKVVVIDQGTGYKYYEDSFLKKQQRLKADLKILLTGESQLLAGCSEEGNIEEGMVEPFVNFPVLCDNAHLPLMTNLEPVPVTSI